MGRPTIGDVVMDRLHAEPRSDDPRVNAIGQLPRSEVEAILRDVDHPLHATAVEHRRLLDLALRPMVERVSQALEGFMGSPAAADMKRSMGIVLKYAAAVVGANVYTVLSDVEVAGRELAPGLDMLCQRLAADLARSTSLAQRNAALAKKVAAMRPPPAIPSARIGGAPSECFGLTRPAPDLLAGSDSLVAQAPRGPDTAARPAAANRNVPAVGAATAAGQAEMNRHLAAIREVLDGQRADGSRGRASAVRVEVATWLALLVAAVSLWFAFRAPDEVEQSISVLVEWQAPDRPPSRTPADDSPPPLGDCLDEPLFPVPSNVPECVPRSWCAH
ncbi:hypothetical protein [Promicromonospora sp. NPDC023987]|uniref:hypothetical protein n=1 Tax=Promicromonospora sp. NPDC023987 TaxID=3155360 RepID=UPI0033FC0143